MKILTCFFRKLIVISCFWTAISPLYAQMHVGQPAGSPDSSAALDVSGGPYTNGSTYRGIAPPKVTLAQTSQAAPITAPATGLLIYNTAKAGDVTPGYYYWEGSKWVRLSTSGTGAARTAAVGDPIPAYTYNEAKALTTAPGDVFMLKEPGQEGLFRNTPVDPPQPAINYPGDTVSANGSRDASGNILNSGTVMLVGGQRYKRVLTDGSINVRWFGANSKGNPDASQAIQRAVNYAKTLYAGNGGWYRATILMPEGSYLINKTIDITKTSGIVIKGDGTRYLNTLITGNTGGIIFDFTGSNLSGCENLSIFSDVGWNNPSTIGVQFAANTDAPIGGNNCTIRNCYIVMADKPTANNGIGTVGIINCTAEEFAVTDCLIKANIGCIFSYKSDLIDAGLNYTISSSYASVRPQLSMGVVNFSGQNSIQNLGKTQPALVLNGTNSFNFHGYLSRGTITGSGTNEAAVLVSGPVTYNLTINSTIESFAQLLRVKGLILNSTINGVVANQTNDGSAFPAGTTRHPVIDLSGGGQLQGCKINITFGNGAAEMDGRYLLYDGGPIYAGIINSEIICPQWPDNSFVASTNLLANSINTDYKIAQPFEKKSVAMMNAVVNGQNFSTVGWTTSTYNQIVPVGTLPSAKLYVMKVIWGQIGVDQVVQSYVFAMSGTDYNGTTVLPVLTPDSVISWGNTTRSVSIRYKAPTVAGQTSYGLEAKINSPDMNNGTLTITIAPLL